MALTPGADAPPEDSFAAEVLKKQKEVLGRIEKVPIAVLLWGPTPAAEDPLATVRLTLAGELQKLGHVANFSEDLVDPSLGHSTVAQQLAHVEAHDVTFSLPSSPGSIAEIHDFARIPGASNKIIAFLDGAWHDGYSNQSLVQTLSVHTVQIENYDAAGLPMCIIDKALDQVRRLQETFYMLGRRFR